MNERNTGGSAFPCLPPQDTAAGSAVGYPFPEAGMTLRDYFAAKAMQGELSSMQDPDGEVCGIALDAPRSTFDRLASHWYRIADAMLAARETA